MLERSSTIFVRIPHSFFDSTRMYVFHVVGVVATADVHEAFSGVHYAILVGAFPRKDGMERKDLLAKNAAIFEVQGKAINDYADPNVKV